MMLSRFLQSVATVPVVFYLNRKIKIYGSPTLWYMEYKFHFREFITSVLTKIYITDCQY